jgi:hypothetical protein
VRNEVLKRVRDEGNILIVTKKRRMANWIGHFLHGNCLPKHVIYVEAEGKNK